MAALDSWGNPTAPWDGLGFSLRFKCPTASPTLGECAFNSLGVATVEGEGWGWVMWVGWLRVERVHGWGY